jgi:hypothetical protein
MYKKKDRIYAIRSINGVRITVDRKIIAHIKS